MNWQKYSQKMPWDVGLMEVESFTVSLFNNRMLIITLCYRYSEKELSAKKKQTLSVSYQSDVDRLEDKNGISMMRYF